MKPKAKLSMVELAAAVASEYASVLKLQDFESVVLRSHLAAEGWLRLLLAVRLGVDTSALPRLSFSAISNLALAACDRAALEENIRRLNSLRNDIAHEFNSAEESAHVWPVVARYRRATGRWRSKWLLRVKVRLLRVSADVFIQVIKALKEKMSPDDHATLREQAPAPVLRMIEEPDALFQILESSSPQRKFTLPDVAEITDLDAGRVAAIASVNAYTTSLEQLGAIHRATPFSGEDLAEIIRRANDVQARNRILLDTVKSWGDAKYEDNVRAQYSELLPLIDWLRNRSQRGAA